MTTILNQKITKLIYELTVSEKDKPKVGDNIVVFPEEGTPYEAQILEINKTDNVCKLLKDKEGTLSERIFQLPLSHERLSFPKREYKVMNLTEYPDHKTGGQIILAELSHVEKTFLTSGESIQCFYNFSVTDPELFVLPLSSEIAQYLINNPEETVMICHKMYFVERDINIDGKTRKASYIFTPPTKQGFIKRSKQLFVYEE